MTSADLQLCVDLRWGYVKYPCIVEPKIDGFRCLVTVDEDGTVHAWSRSGTEWPKVAATLSELARFPGQWFDGELVIGGSWATTNAAKNRGWEFDPNDLAFIVFDGPSDVMMWHTYHVGSAANPVCCRDYKAYAANREDIETWYRKFVNAGYEGIVVKAVTLYASGRSGNWQRLKPCMTEDVPQPDGTVHEMFRGEVVRIRTAE